MVKKAEQIELLRQANHLVAKTLAELAPHVTPGTTTLSLDLLAETFIRDHGALPGFKGYEGFPFTLCISVNEVVVHGFPSAYRLQEGDIVSIDCGTIIDGYFGDSAFTFSVGQVSPQAQGLLDVTRESLELGIAAACPGHTTGHIGHAVQAYAEKAGYGVVRDLVGHGLGTDMHERPEVPNYGRPGSGSALRPGMVICIEPMITQGDYRVVQQRDGWGIVTRDGKWAAHFEKAIAITAGEPDVLTDFSLIDAALARR